MSKRHGGVLFLTICLSLLGLVSISSAAQAEDKKLCEDWAAKVASVQGKVEAKRTISDEWEAVNRDNTYCPGDQIRVGKKSRASIVFANETIVRLDQFSALTITEIKKEGLSLLELVEGIAHFISRVPRSLKVKTPFVNAAIEGTEFVVEVNDKDTTVTVFEGTVLTQNDSGEVRITDNESAKAEKDQAPEKILIAKPRDAVQWALYFPPVIKGNADGSDIEQASDLLYNGRADEAAKLLQGNDSAEAKSLMAIIAIVDNNKDEAFKLANEAVQQSPDSAAAHIALSYAWQSKLDLDQALNSANTATVKENNNAIAWARLAELQLSTGQLNDALASSKKANEIDSNIARSRTILGYAYLTRIDTDNARKTFNEAIELNQVDPLPRLGLGLARIRDNELAEGRREIEIAASLDPNNAIIRSYLGKAYFEEKRGPLDAEQFAMAKALDPNDPTPYFYDAIRKQTENDPIGALEDLNKSIALNDNRAVYRSSLQLDQDEATRSVSLAKVYQELGFEESAVNDATRSIANDPMNHSAHRFLADAYANRPRHEIAQASELLQTQMLQPLSLTPLQPQSLESDLDTPSYTNSFGNSSSDFSNLYARNSSAANFNIFAGNHSTKGAELTIAGLYDNFAISAAQFNYQSDGFRFNNDVEHDISNLFIQFQATPKLSFQSEYIIRETEKGDLELLFDPNVFAPNERNKIESEQGRLGVTYKMTPSTIFLASHIYKELSDSEVKIDTGIVPFPFTQTVTIATDLTTRTSEIQFIKKLKSINYLTGITHINLNRVDSTTTHFIAPTLPLETLNVIPSFRDTEHSSVYLYGNYQAFDWAHMTLGASYEEYSTADYDINKLNPKAGIIIDFSDLTKLSIASMKLVNRPFTASQTLEPTNISGFNQFFDDVIGSKITIHGIELSNTHHALKSGLKFTYRDIDIPRYNGSNLVFDDFKELNYIGYVYWTINNNLNINLTGKLSNIENINEHIIVAPLQIKTTEIPLEFRYRYGNLSLNLVPTYVSQDFTDFGSTDFHDSFTVLNTVLSYAFSKQRGHVSFAVNNATDENFNFYGLDFTNEAVEHRYTPSRSVFIQLNLNL